MFFIHSDLPHVEASPAQSDRETRHAKRTTHMVVVVVVVVVVMVVVVTIVM